MTRKIIAPSLNVQRKLVAAASFAAIVVVFSLAAFPASSSKADEPKYVVEDDCSAFAFSTDNHLAYAVRRIYNYKKYTLEGDDLWTSTADGKRKRLIDGEKLAKTTSFRSYSIHDLKWSPDNRRLTIAETTEQINDSKRGDIASGENIQLMDADGHEIPIALPKDAENPFIGASQGVWLADGVTVAYVVESVKPRLLFEIRTIQPASGKVSKLFAGHLYAAVSWDAAHSTAFAVERDRGIDGPAELVWLDLVHELRTHVASMQSFQGQLTVSPTGRRVGYFRDGDYLEIRELTPQSKPLSLRVGYGRFEWSPDERFILLKRGPETRSGNMVWISIPGGDFFPAMHDLVYRDFHISPDGQWVGLMEIGKRIIKVYPTSGLLPPVQSAMQLRP